MKHKTIYILRHGKAEDGNNHDDFRRALTPSGEKDIRAAALAMLNAAPPDYVISSAAARAAQTTKTAAAMLGMAEKQQIFGQELYEANRLTWLARLRRQSEKTGAVLLVGHNPALEVLIRKLSGLAIDLPPGGLVALRYDGAWKSIAACKLTGAHYPARYYKRLPPISKENIFNDEETPLTPQNRELSWLSFNARILQEAADKSNNPIERLTFAGVVSSNLDEFYRVRMGSVSAILQRKKGAHPMRALSLAVRKRVQKMQEDLTQLLDEILHALADAHDILFVDEKSIDRSQRKTATQIFETDVRAGLSVVMQPDKKTLHSYLKTDAIYLAARLLNAAGKRRYALVEVFTRKVGRFIPLPITDGDGARRLRYLWLDDLLRLCLPDYFRPFGYVLESAHCIKITRTAEMEESNGSEERDDALIFKMLKKRDVGNIVRLMYDGDIPADVLGYFRRRMDLAAGVNVFASGRYHNHRDFIGFRPPIRASGLTSAKSLPVKGLSEGASYFQAAEKKDLLLHFPHHSFRHLINLLREASLDPKVTHIDITLYRVAEFSEVIDALVNAMYNGKEVRVMMEIKARFNEEDNLRWRRLLIERGINVLKEIPNKKVHAKVCLIRRNNRPDVAIFSTGNFNETTARLYCDVALITTNAELTADAARFFSLLENPEKAKIAEGCRHLLASPHAMRQRIVELIHREMENAAAGKPAHIYLKLNNLNDPGMTRLLHRAAINGVLVNLIVRSTFSLNPELPEYEGRMRAVSIVDTLLEHARIFVFANGGDDLVYLSSADFLPRNLDRRFELATPVPDKGLRRELLELLQLQLSDNVKARLLNAAQDNAPQHLPGAPKIRAQKALAKLLQ